MQRVCFWVRARCAFSLVALCAGIHSDAAIPHDEYRARRAALRKTLDGTLVLFGRKEGPDEVYSFTQEPNFYYLTGWTEPGAILLLTATQEILFLPHHDPVRERFAGPRASAEDASAHAGTGFENVFPLEKFESAFARALESSGGVYMLPDEPEWAALRRVYPLRRFENAAPLIAALRVRKSAAELSAIRHATDISIQGHLAAWKRLTAGLFEYQLAATTTNVFLENGCEGNAYAPIVGSGPNAVILHYSANNRRVENGELVLIDAAAECGEYASDITRTVPVSGKFTPRQRELYEVVLGAQKAALAQVRPGARLNGRENSLTAIARNYMDSHGHDLRGGRLGQYFTHGIGHQVGIDVHDADNGAPLEEGMVITIEPGLYVPEEDTGIRIEDVVLVTANGAEVLSTALPKEPGEVEKALAR